MGKNIVVCCDGTGNQYGERRTNVLELFAMLERSPRQVAYYDPGVGTLSAPAALTRTARFVTRLLGLGFGYGITRNIGDAYRFVIDTWEPGDTLYFFGFSRGAYTVRALAALLYKCGLLEKGNENLIPYALRLFKYERRQKIYRGFRSTFSRRPPVRFLGLWDTVKTVGWIYDPVKLQFTMRNPIVRTVRQALAIDERRCFYRQNLWGKPYRRQDVRQVWFAGSHSDVGGSYPESESGLSRIALRWMAEEASHAGLRFDPARSRELLTEPLDPEATMHRSLRGLWWLPELVPRLYEDPRRDFRRRWMISLGRRRHIEPGCIVHVSVAERARRLGYRPPNLPDRWAGVENAGWGGLGSPLAMP